MFSCIAFHFHNGTDFFAGVFSVPFIEQRLFRKGKTNKQKSSIHAGLRWDGSPKAEHK